jgi:abortive infection Abi-like protein
MSTIWTGSVLWSGAQGTASNKAMKLTAERSLRSRSAAAYRRCWTDESGGVPVIRLFATGGSQDIELLERRLRPDVWQRLREGAARLLRARGEVEAADLFLGIPFELWKGTNGWNDDFQLLYAELPLDEYLRVSAMQGDARARAQFRHVARAMQEVEQAIRFVAVSYDENSEPMAVAAPSLATTSDVLERALGDVERSLREGQPAHGVDRIHTALHVYLGEVARSAGLQLADDASTTDIFRLLRQHPSLLPTGPRAGDLTRVIQSMASVVDALNPIRNRASLAHPTDALLDPPEAMLVVNAVRTLLHFLESKLG